MDTLSWTLVGVMLASWCVVGGYIAWMHVDYRKRLRRSAHRRRMLIAEIDNGNELLAQARRQNAGLRDEIATLQRRVNVNAPRPIAATTAGPRPRAAMREVPTLEVRQDLPLAAWNAFADTQVDETNTNPGFLPTQPMRVVR